MDKETELKRAKRTALLLLLAATAIFLAASALPRTLWVDGVRTVAEAAMVGALADWFAVTALFRRVPIPFVAAHTNIIPNKRERIADNLALFVKEKFLDAGSLVDLIRRHDPASKVADWLLAPANTRVLGVYVTRLASGILDVADDGRIQAFMKNALDTALARLDLSQTAGTLLDTLTRDGRHQDLLDEVIDQVIQLLREPESRDFIAERLAEWLRSDHPLLDKVLPASAAGYGADKIADALDTVLQQVGADRQHALRDRFDEAMQRLIKRLKADPAFHAKGEEIKDYLRHSESLATYGADLWNSLRAWLQRDIARDDSQLHQRVAAMGAWIGREIAGSPELRRSLNEHLEDLARAMAPDFSAFLTRHISDTVRKWDPQDMSRQIELNIGKDLQYIRINGTLVGGLIGLLLFASSHLVGALASGRAG